MLERVCAPVRLEGAVGMEVLSNLFPICHAWLLISNNKIGADTLPQHAQLDVVLLSVVA
jgi:hypothetical protein